MQEYTVTVGEYSPGTIRYYKPGTEEMHRIDGPAVEFASGAKHWIQDGMFHRTDGPAIEFTEGTVEYWIEGNKLTLTQFKKATAPAKEMTIAEIEAVLGHAVKVVK